MGSNRTVPDGRSFGQVFHDEYRVQRRSTVSKVSGVLFPISIVAMFFVHSAIAAIACGVAAVVLLIATVVWAKHERDHGRAPSSDGPS